MFTALGFALACLMGLTLGLIGAGGSILTVPILVYFFSIKPITATGYSLLVVGCTAAMGAINYWRQSRVSVQDALIFAIPAMIMVTITRRYILPSLPETLITVSHYSIHKDMFIMLMFSILMLVAAIFMFKPIKIKEKPVDKRSLTTGIKLLGGSASIGLLTGMVGAGGGFLIIPTLTGLFGLGMKEAIGTSLAIIAMNSLVGFKGDLVAGISLNWHLLSIFLLLTFIGMASGIYLNQHANPDKLKKLFAVFTLITSFIIMYQELQLLF